MSRVIYKTVIRLAPVTKKNSQRILRNKAGHYFIAPSKAYCRYEKEAGWFIRIPERPLAKPVNVKAIYYMPNRRRVDIVNLHEALHDLLVKHGVLEDDNYKIVAATDGSRVKYDKNNPRTEVEISEIEE